MDSRRPRALSYSRYLDDMSSDIATLTQLLSSHPADFAVPTCPGWSLSVLGAHAGDFAAYYSHRLCDATGARRPPWPNSWRHGTGAPLEDTTAAAYFEERARFLLDLLRATPADAKVETWNKNDQTARFVARRATHEFAVHRVDAEIATGEPQRPIAIATAVDGIEEIFTMLEHLDMFERDRAASGETLHLEAQDAGRHWLIALETTSVKVTAHAAAADLTISGSASDLELLLYGRPTAGSIRRRGSGAVLDAWYRTFRFG